MEHLEDILTAASIEDPLLHGGRWYVTKDAALAGMTSARIAAMEEAAAILDGEAAYFIQERDKEQAEAFKRFGPDERKGDDYWNSREMQAASYWGAKRDATENGAGLIRKLKE